MHATSGLSPGPRAWIVVLSVPAVLQIAFGLLALALSAWGFVEWQSETVVRDWQRALQIAAFSALAGYVLVAGRGDTRAVYLGVLLMLVAVFYANPALSALEDLDNGGSWVSALRAFPVDAFTPAIAWLFARDFPRTLEWRRSGALVRVAIRACIIAALALIAANLFQEFAPPSSVPTWLVNFDRGYPWSHYWTVVFGLLLPTLPFVFWRSLHARSEEQGRVRLFATGLAVFAASPVLFSTLAPTLPEIFRGDWAEDIVVPLNQLMVLGLAGTAAYSVLVANVLDVRVVLRAAAQYALARGVAWSLASIPFAWIAVILHGARAEPLTAVASGPRLLMIVGLLVAGSAALRLRRRVMFAVDQFFFREAYDPQTLLSAIASHARNAGSTASLLGSVADELDERLHLDSIAILAAVAEGDAYLPAVGAIRRLPHDSALARALSEQPSPTTVAHLGHPPASLPQQDRLWLTDSGADLLVPMVGIGGALTGLLALGSKRSQLPFSRQDELLLETVGNAVGIALESRILRESGGIRQRAREVEGHAAECNACGLVVQEGAEACTACGGTTRSAALPRRLLGKFELDCRIGEGAMGIVYRARDLALDRDVALKTLPATAPEDAVRLRREARSMAAVVDPNLATIYGAETWLGTPVLVIEYLAGGTLEDRRGSFPLLAPEVFTLAAVLAEALRSTHTKGMLHRDVKPSNIGFTADGTAKLLDFGLAQIVGRASDADHSFAGTPLYMSPEALEAERPEPGFDLWSLAIVTCESICGAHPFARATTAESYAAIKGGWTEANDALLPEAAKPAARFFQRSLARDRSRRPSTAQDLASDILSAAKAVSGGRKEL